MISEDTSLFLAEKDPVLGRIINSQPFPHYHNTFDVFEDLASCILDMRIHYASSPAAFRYPRMKKLLQQASITPEIILAHSPEIFDPLKLSRQKDESLKFWARKWTQQNYSSIDWKTLKDPEVYQLLTEIRGVGEWTVQMIMIFSLERKDIFPAADYQLKKAMAELYGLNEDPQLEKQLIQIAENWIPYRSLGVRYLWRWREQRKNGTGGPSI